MSQGSIPPSPAREGDQHAAPAGEAPAPYVPAEANLAELSARAIALGMVFGVIFGAATVYLALKAGLTVSASIPIAVLVDLACFERLGGSTILENNIVQTIGSAGESIAAGVVFTLPGFLFLAATLATGVSVGAPYFSYWTIFTLALLGGVLGVLMMIPLRRSLIVKEHATLPYPRAPPAPRCSSPARRAASSPAPPIAGLGFAFVYAILQKVFRVIAETPTLAIRSRPRCFPPATVERRDHARVPGRRLHHRPAHRRRARRGRRARLARRSSRSSPCSCRPTPSPRSS